MIVRLQHLFPGPEPVLDYIQQFASNYVKHIRLSTRVLRLRHSDRKHADDNERKWLVEVVDLKSDTLPAEEQFDRVFVANGHYSAAYVPWIENLSSFSGEILHSRWFRSAEAFLNQTVLVVGNGASGYDATREIADSIHRRRVQDPTAQLPRIYQSARSPSALGIPFDDPSAPDWAKEVSTFGTIDRVDGKKITFSDGRSLQDVDVMWVYLHGLSKVAETVLIRTCAACSPPGTSLTFHSVKPAIRRGVTIL